MVKNSKKHSPANQNSGSARRNRSFELLWGAQQRASRGPKPALSLDAVVRAAIEVVDTEGMSALTMARVAAQLGVTTMALYRYVPGKDELVDLIIDAALGTPPASGGQNWRTEISQWARAELALFHGRPWLLDAVMRRAPIGPNWLAWMNGALDALSGSGLSASEMIAATLLVDGHIRSAAQIALGAPGTGQWAENFGRVLQTASSDARYAALARVASSGGFNKPRESTETPFDFGLNRILDGIETYIRARTRRQERKTSARSR